MALFSVTNIINGNTIAVSGWTWKGEYSGTKVIISGYDIKNGDYDPIAKNKLEILLRDKQVELKNVIKAEKSNTSGDDTIYCSVYLNDIDISQYFPELKTSA